MITEFPLFVFTTLGGLGAGLYAADAVFPVDGKQRNLLMSIVPLVLLGIGGVALLLHLGHPERALNAFANPTAGITMEAFACMAFGLVLVIDLALVFAKDKAPKALRVVGGIVAVILCIVMGWAYFSYESVAAWHAAPTIPLFLCGDLAVGAALLGALGGEVSQSKTFTWVLVALAVVSAVVFAGEGALFAGLKMSMVPFACAAVLAIAAAAVAFLAHKKSSASLYWVAFACMFVAVIVARYAFYSVI